MSSNVCRVTHLLRAVGNELPLEDVLAFDEGLEASLGFILGGSIHGRALDRAVCGASEGGLGLRRAREVQFPAFLASRTEARPLASDVSAQLPPRLRCAVFDVWDADVRSATTA